MVARASKTFLMKLFSPILSELCIGEDTRSFRLYPNEYEMYGTKVCNIISFVSVFFSTGEFELCSTFIVVVFSASVFPSSSTYIRVCVG